MVQLEVHDNFRHDCTEDPRLSAYHVTKPYQFRKGDKIEVPDDVAAYFCEAGWCAKPGEQPVKPDPGKAVTLQPHNASLTAQGKSPA